MIARRSAIVLVVLGLLIAPARARADSDALTQSRAHSEAGRALYTLGRYEEALREFTAGYELVPNPRFLVNIGQSHRQLGQLERARAMYRRYLGEAPIDDALRAEVTGIITELDRSIAEAPALVIEQPPAAPPRHSFLRRHWWIIPVSGVVLAGIAVGIYFGLRPASSLDCGAVALGCVDASR